MSSIESEYLMSMENTEQYKGKWIAILDTEIIAEVKIFLKCTKKQ